MRASENILSGTFLAVVESAAAESREPRIWVLDDDSALLASLKEDFARHGFTLWTAQTAQEALKQLEHEPPDAVLLNFRLADMDGIELCKRLRGTPVSAHVPVIVITETGDADAITTALDAGATDVVQKPLYSELAAHRLQYMLRARADFQALQKSEQRLVNAQRVAKLGSWEWRYQDEFFELSLEAAEMFGVAPAQRVPLKQFWQLIAAEDVQTVRNAFDKLKAEGGSAQIEYCIIHGFDRSARIICHSMEVTSATGVDAGAIGAIQDVTERRQAEREILNLAYYDPLTGLPNRSFMRQHLEHVFAQARQQKRIVAVLFLDLDLFKRVNDTFGHHIGDAALVQAAERLRRCVRRGELVAQPGKRMPGPNEGRMMDSVARLGGDEFIVVLPEISQMDDASIVAKRLAEALSRPIHLADQEVVLTASIGIALYPEDGQDVETVLKHADMAMYSAKERGRQNIQFYSANVTRRAAQRMHIENRMRTTLQEGGFHLVYQPQLDCNTGEVRGLEALLRWNDAELGEVSPVECIPVAEETGLISPLGLWVMTEATAALQRLENIGFNNLLMAVNVSAYQLRNAIGARQLLQFIESSPAINKLELELTEGAIVGVPEVLGILQRLRSKGVAIALDDFGTGYSSLAQLRGLPIDCVKIDRAFLHGIGVDEDSAAVLSSIIRLGKSLKMKIVAEGVEDEMQAEFIARHSSVVAQGFYYARPMTEDKLVQWLADRRAQVS